MLLWLCADVAALFQLVMFVFEMLFNAAMFECVCDDMFNVLPVPPNIVPPLAVILLIVLPSPVILPPPPLSDVDVP